jgi:sugar/nucleoside kinase (ribokinase family)
MIHAEQVRKRDDIRYRFAGVYGRDANGESIRELLEKTGFLLDDYTLVDQPTPCTDVLSDATFAHGRGEGTFLNTAGGRRRIWTGISSGGLF